MTSSGLFRRLHGDERGVALITAMLVGMVVLSLGLVTVQLSAHNVDASALDRKRVQAVHAAEAGLDTYLALLPRTPLLSIQCTPGATAIPIETGAQFQVTATFYPTFPGIAGQEMTCPLSPNTPPRGAVIVSRGTAVAIANVRAVSRTMQTEVRLNPIFGAFGAAIFSDRSFGVQNNLTVSGNNGNDGDIYTNGNFNCTNSSVDYGTVVTQGTATLGNSCTVLQDLRANGSITMNNTSRVGHDAVSSTGSITMNQSTRIDNNARAATTCSGCHTPSSGLTPVRVGGSATERSPSPTPTRYDFPVINWDRGAWTSAGYTVNEFSSCPSAKEFIQNGATPGTNYVVRITANCVLQWGTNDPDVPIRGNIAIITNGSIDIGQFNDFVSTSGTRNMYFIVPRDAVTSLPCSQNITVGNNTNFTNVQTFWYTPCTATFHNNNIGLGGQIYAGQVNIQNQMTFSFRPLLIPGTGAITGFTPDIAYIREITNARPPTA